MFCNLILSQLTCEMKASQEYMAKFCVIQSFKQSFSQSSNERLLLKIHRPYQCDRLQFIEIYGQQQRSLSFQQQQSLFWQIFPLKYFNKLEKCGEHPSDTNTLNILPQICLNIFTAFQIIAFLEHLIFPDISQDTSSIVSFPWYWSVVSTICSGNSFYPTECRHFNLLQVDSSPAPSK